MSIARTTPCMTSRVFTVFDFNHQVYRRHTPTL